MFETAEEIETKIEEEQHATKVKNSKQTKIPEDPFGIDCEMMELLSYNQMIFSPLLRDPWEDTRVYVSGSGLPQGGEGLFAKKDFGEKEVVALYNGIKFKNSTYAADHLPRSDYRIRLNGDFDMDIPKGYHLTSQYCATLAHKANHSFRPNVEWTLFEHPRFGLIR